MRDQNKHYTKPWKLITDFSHEYGFFFLHICSICNPLHIDPMKLLLLAMCKLVEACLIFENEMHVEIPNVGWWRN